MKCECGTEMQLQGVESYFEEGKEPSGARYYFCSNCKEWKTVSDEKFAKVQLEEKNEYTSVMP